MESLLPALSVSQADRDYVKSMPPKRRPFKPIIAIEESASFRDGS
jgi:hypothetical protein